MCDSLTYVHICMYLCSISKEAKHNSILFRILCAIVPLLYAAEFGTYEIQKYYFAINGLTSNIDGN